MNGKEYVEAAIGKAEGVLSGLRSSGKLQGDPLLDSLAKACSDLGQFKNRATLKTKPGVNMALPVFEASQNLEESWEEARAAGGLEEFRTCLEEFVQAAEVLGGALKERTVVMT